MGPFSHTGTFWDGNETFCLYLARVNCDSELARVGEFPADDKAGKGVRQNRQGLSSVAAIVL